MTVLYATVAVVFSTILSVVYNLLSRSKLRRIHMARTTAVHAFTIEALQLIVLINGLTLSCNALHPKPVSLYSSEIPRSASQISTLLPATGTFATHVLAMFTIDIIDNFIQLGTVQHPVQAQTLLLTRSILFPGTIKRTTPARSTRKTVPCERIRGRSRTRKVLVSSTLPIDRADVATAMPTKLYELEGSLPSEAFDVLERASSVRRASGVFIHKSRPLSTPSNVRNIGMLLDSSGSSTSTRTSTNGSLIKSSDHAVPAPPKRATSSSPATSHIGTSCRPTSTSDLHESPAAAAYEQPEFARSFSAQTTPPTTPIETPIPMTPDSLPSRFNRPSPAFTCSTVSSALKVRPRASMSTRSVQAARGGSVEMKDWQSSASRGSPGLVKDTVKFFEESS